MPELPEVETIKNELLPQVVGRKVTGITLFWEKMVVRPSVAEFRARLIGQEVSGVGRRGKYLLFYLRSGEVLVIHLRMTGSLLLETVSSDNRFTRAIIHLDGISINFRDPRKFGVMWLAENANELDSRLGPEPFGDEFTSEILGGLLRNRTASVKALLLDQSLIAGIGNMYADEALFATGIHPLRSGGSLSRDEIKRLYHSIRQVLQEAIGNKGASVQNYFRPGGETGRAHHEFKVAHRGGNPCFTCGTTIQRIPIRNRGSYFCPKCQPEP
ncbi:bifunctional DNA-formamidopyrimidine glycosylase/DNA-(apurinic or apyrimidinic site) lyase [Chloroflexota bacterium]